MSVPVRMLVAILVVQLVVGAVLTGRRLFRPEPPLPDLSTLDPMTAADLRAVRQQARDGNVADWRTLGQAYLGYGYYTEAEACLRYAARLNPDDLESVYGLGFCLERVGRTNEAIPVLHHAAALAASSNADQALLRTCWYQIGRCYLREENAAEAETALRRIADFPPAAYHLARLLVRTGRAAEAAVLLDERLAQQPNSLKLLQQRARAAEAMQDSESARRFRARAQRAEFQLVLEYGMSYISMFRARYGLSRQMAGCMKLGTEGTPPERRNCLQQLLQFVRKHRLPQYQKMFVTAAQVELGLKQPDNALALLDEAANGGHVSPTTEELRGDAWQQKGDATRSAAYWERAIRLGPSPDLYHKLADHYRRSGERSLADRQEALQYQLEGMWHYRHNEVEPARRDLEKSLALAPDDARSWYYLGAVRRVSGEGSRAIEAYTRCLELDPDFQRARVEREWLGR